MTLQPLLPADLRLLTADHLAALVEAGVAESQVLDYKEQLPGAKDSEKKDFLADVAALANTRGGHLIYGVVEQRDDQGQPTGVPAEVRGLPEMDFDKDRKRLEEICLYGIAPRLSGLSLTKVEGFSSGSALVIHVPKSWSGPHVIAFQDSSRFYARSGGSNYIMNVDQIRDAFQSSRSERDRAEQWRRSRLELMKMGRQPVPVKVTRSTTLHLVPLSTQSVPGIVDPADDALSSLEPLIVRGNRRSFLNFDGRVSYNDHSYSLLFRDGAIEGAENFMLSREEKKIPTVPFEETLIKALNHYLNIHRQLGITAPWLLGLTLRGIEGFELMPPEHLSLFGYGRIIDRPDLEFPMTLVEEDQPADIILRPVFDHLWQGAGWDGCFNYDDDGRWRRPS